MVRSCWVLAVVIGIGRAAAQEPEFPVRRLTVTPAAAPVPALRYTLLPDLRDTTPGNAALLYYRAFSPEWWSAYQRDRTMADKLSAAAGAPAAELKKAASTDIDWVRNTHMLHEVDRAARRAYCDWELTPRIREDGISLLLPDVQSMRAFGVMLAVRARLEIADGQFDKADYTFQTSFQMGRHVSEATTLIQALVGAAVAGVTLDQVEEWIRTPGSPNLYWALSTLPQPFIDLRMPLQGERIFLDNLFPGYRDALKDPAKDPPVLSADLRQKMAEAFETGTAPSVFFMALTAKKYTAAKAYLAAHGRTAAQIEALPAVSAVMLYEVATYDRLYDELLKWQGQPYPVARAGLAAAERELKEEVVRSGAPGLSLAGYLMPAVLKVHFAGVNTDRKINMLRTVEAIRMHAAAHGKLPAKLADITEVPVPTDPLTGNPFDYQIDGDKAILTAPPPAGEQPYERNSRRYEITLAK